MFDSPVTTRCLSPQPVKSTIKKKNQLLKPLSNRQSQNVILNSKQWLDISGTLFTHPTTTGFLYNSPNCVSHCIRDWPRTLLPLSRVPLGLKQWAMTTHGPSIFEGPVCWGKAFQAWYLSSIHRTHSQRTYCPDLSTRVEANTSIIYTQ